MMWRGNGFIINARPSTFARCRALADAEIIHNSDLSATQDACPSAPSSSQRAERSFPLSYPSNYVSPRYKHIHVQMTGSLTRGRRNSSRPIGSHFMFSDLLKPPLPESSVFSTCVGFTQSWPWQNGNKFNLCTHLLLLRFTAVPTIVRWESR